MENQHVNRIPYSTPLSYRKHSLFRCIITKDIKYQSILSLLFVLELNVLIQKEIVQRILNISKRM